MRYGVPSRFTQVALGDWRMAYQVIARKWRPQDFGQLVGQEHVSQTLLNALRHQRLHHALLFTGPRGTGKTSSARILAKALRCPNAKDYIPCHECAECQEIASGRSLNVVEIDGASNNGVDAIRELRDTVGYMPSSGHYKLYIIDEVHMLSTSAFNALLKTLEEPPPHVIFVMATTEVQKIPETVLSRVQRFDFRCIPTRAIVAHLKSICDAEGIEVESEALWTIARQGAGSMRDSQSFLDQAITFAGQKLTAAKVTDVLGLTDRSLLLGALTALVEQNVQAMLGTIEKILTAGYEPRLFIQDLLEQIRHLLLVKLLGDGTTEGIVEVPDSELATLKSLSARMGAEDLHLLFDMALKGANDLGRAPDPRIALEMTLLRMTDAPRLVAIESLLRAKPAVTAPSVAPAATSTPPAVAPAPVPTSAVAPAIAVGAEGWFELVKRIQSVNSVIGAQLENCFLHELKDQKITLGVQPKMKFLADKLNTPDFKKKVINYVTTFWGPGYQLEVVSVEPKSAEAVTPKARQEQQQEEARQNLLKQVEEHPLMKTTKSLFKTEIRAIKENKS